MYGAFISGVYGMHFIILRRVCANLNDSSTHKSLNLCLLKRLKLHLNSVHSDLGFNGERYVEMFFEDLLKRELHKRLN